MDHPPPKSALRPRGAGSQRRYLLNDPSIDRRSQFLSPPPQAPAPQPSSYFPMQISMFPTRPDPSNAYIYCRPFMDVHIPVFRPGLPLELREANFFEIPKTFCWPRDFFFLGVTSRVKRRPLSPIWRLSLLSCAVYIWNFTPWFLIWDRYCCCVDLAVSHETSEARFFLLPSVPPSLPLRPAPRR